MPTPDKPAGIEFYGGYQVYSESGVDLTLLRENLKRTVEQRLENNARSLRLVAAFQESDPAKSRLGKPSRRPVMLLEVGDILRALADHRVEYVLIGDLAMRVQGSAYVAADLAICYCRAPENIAALASALAVLPLYVRDAPPDLAFPFDVPTLQAGLNFTLVTDLGDIDLLGEVSGIGDFDRVLARSEEHEMFGLRVWVLSIDGLIAAKKAADRIKDKLHLLELEELKKLRDAAQGEN